MTFCICICTNTQDWVLIDLLDQSAPEWREGLAREDISSGSDDYDDYVMMIYHHHIILHMYMLIMMLILMIMIMVTIRNLHLWCDLTDHLNLLHHDLCLPRPRGQNDQFQFLHLYNHLKGKPPHLAMGDRF